MSTYTIPKTAIRKWCKVLRSGKYKQGRNRLEYKGHFCCLGVACLIFIPKPLQTREPLGLWGGMPVEQQHAPLWLQKINMNFASHTGTSLSELNDADLLTFDEIADCLEAVYLLKVME